MRPGALDTEGWIVSQQQPTPFARIILTPILLIVAALLLSQVVPDYSIVLLAGAGDHR
jgi:hypothetical protein